jgi:hypothetical protein
MNYFLLTDQEKGIQKLDGEYKAKLSYHVKEGNLNLLEYSYMLDYYDTKGTIVNVLWYITLVNKLADIELNQIVEQIFPSLLEVNPKETSSILLKTTDLSKKIIKEKKKHIKFTGDQKDAIKQIFDFLPDTKRKTYGLYGYAGTGKTTIIVEMLTFLLKHKLIKSIVFTAPTNKAVNVMKSKFRGYLKYLYNAYYDKDPPEHLNFDEILDKFYEVGIKIDFITIHKLLKFELDFGSDGDLVFVKGSGESLISQYEVIVIDECSMIPIKLVEHIFSELRSQVQKKCDNYKKMPKIIFSGDPAQLPPVSEKLSIIFLNKDNIKNFKLADYTTVKEVDKNESHSDQNQMTDAFFGALKNNTMETKYNTLVNDILNMPTTTLKKVMRSKLECVTNICYQVRLWTIGEVNVPDMQPYVRDGVSAYKYNGEQKIKTDWFKKCLEYCKAGKESNIILTWTNRQADEYNQTIRKILFNNTKIKRFEIGDVLILNDFYNMDDGQDDYLDDAEKKFYTSEQIKISNTELISKKINDFNSSLNKKAMKLQNSKHYELQYKKIMDEINTSTKRVYLCWKLTVKKISDSIDDTKDCSYVIYVINEESEKLWIREKEYVSELIKKLRKTLISKFREKTSTIETNIIKPLWREWHKNMIEPFANVNYGYAITCHKGQGSNFYNVFVDIDDIVKNNNEDETKKCVYTAITRTSNELHMLL